MMPRGPRIDLIGKRYGRLLVIAFDHTDKECQFWQCQCDCGVVKVIRGNAMRQGMTRSCGCLVTDTNGTHGMSKTRLYKRWATMWRRCAESQNISYQYYGARG